MAVIVAAFGVAAAVIAVAGTRLAGIAVRLARDTGLGQAVFGTVFLGGATSLPGLVTSITAASSGHAALAVSNGLGGIAAQTVFLAVADAVYPKANLEHASASPSNLLLGALMITLLAIPLLGIATPEVAVLGVHPTSALLVVGYVLGIRLLRHVDQVPMWTPTPTDATAPPEERAARPGRGDARAWVAFAALAITVGVAGYVIAVTGHALAVRTGVGESVVGTFLTAISTSLPELVTAIAAVRRGALILAVGDILGGNCFDVLFVAASDVAYRDGSIYAAIGRPELFVTALTILLTGILVLGMLRRERRGIANIGFESFLVIVLYLGGAAYLVATGT